MTDASASRPFLSEHERFARLRLIRCGHVGPATFRMLINRFGSAEQAIKRLPELAARGGSRNRITIPEPIEIEREYAAARRFGATFVHLGDTAYPLALAAEGSAPPVLTVMGTVELLNRPSIAVVGARNASIVGQRLTRQFASALGAAGYAIISGLARGVDTAAHEASMETGTIGVFAGGLDRPYPKENRPLMRSILDTGGCLITEMPFGWEPRAADFPRRNRIVAGSAIGLLVVEAALRSGSLISARLAAEMGRLVFAVPGSPLDPRAAGANRLLKEGALIATEPADLLEALAPLDGRTRNISPAGVDLFEVAPPQPQAEPSETDRIRVVEALSTAPISIEDLMDHVDCVPAAVQLALLELELAGRIERHPGGFVSRIG